MTYKIKFHTSAERELAKLPRTALMQAIQAIVGLVTVPRSHNAKALVGEPPGTLRVRSGDYRVIYFVDDEARIVTVIRVAHRRDAYK